MPKQPAPAARTAAPVRITSQGTVSIPRPLLKALGIGPGTIMSPEVRGRTVVLTPKVLIDWDAQGKAAAARARAGVGLSRPFDTAAELVDDLHRVTRKRRSVASQRRKK